MNQDPLWLAFFTKKSNFTAVSVVQMLCSATVYYTYTDRCIMLVPTTHILNKNYTFGGN